MLARGENRFSPWLSLLIMYITDLCCPQTGQRLVPFLPLLSLFDLVGGEWRRKIWGRGRGRDGEGRDIKNGRAGREGVGFRLLGRLLRDDY